ncbi:hypothetical protein [Aliarcobacter cryaerophilus]|uniref:hypothetical protein n=1 Tax=Aliarcobacter cryaerophilus TaxID=28198 RepID=UPI00112F6D41|nr:hypothetical protein [Aliarcobacter cryaerophilus]
MNKIKNKFTDIHFDTFDTILNNEHIGNYVIYISESKNHSITKRLYLDLEKNIEFYKEKFLKGFNHYKQTPIKRKQHIFTHFKTYNKLIVEILDLIFTQIYTSSLTKDIIKGIFFMLDFIKNSKYYQINSIHDFIKASNFLIRDLSNLKNIEHEKKCIRSLLSKLELALDTMFLNKQIFKVNKQILEGYSSNVLYKLDYYTRKELDQYISEKLKLTKYIDTYKNINLFSIENLFTTFQKTLDKNIKKRIHHIALYIYKINLNEYFNENSDGINIEITHKYMFILWLQELYSDFPFCKNPKNKYKNIFYFQTFITENSKITGISLGDIINFYYPKAVTIYPLILFLLIREGINSECLSNIKVIKQSDKFIIEAKENLYSLVIQTKKYRSNTKIEIFLDKKSLQFKYIEFFLSILQDTYKKTNNNEFFQYYQGGSFRQLKISDYFSNINLSKNSIVNKYDIRDLDNKRILSINHRRIRPSANYQYQLQGLSHTEKQLKLDHKNLDTSQHYDNNIEHKLNINLKIFKIQTQIQNLFLGKIERNNTSQEKLFNGLLADCSDPTTPQKDSFCLDWYKCLINCNKAKVFPKIHGPIIYSRLKYINNLKYNTLNVKDWEKEFFQEYASLINVLKYFTKKERFYSFNNYKKYSGTVNKIFYKKNIKLKNYILSEN